MKNGFVFFGLIFLLGFASCEQDVTLEFKHEPKLCINCILNPDSVINANLTVSHKLDNTIQFESVDNGTIKIFENDVLFGVLKNKGNGEYYLNQKPHSNKSYKIIAEAANHKAITAFTTIPEHPAIEYRFDTTGFIPNLNKYIFDLNISLIDYPGNNFYWLYETYILKGVKYGGGQKEINAPFVDDFNRSIDNESKYGFTHFLQIRISDEGYDGDTLKFVIPDYYSNEEYDAQHFLNADEHYDKYIKTTIINRMKETSELPFYEPVQVYTNIENGYGIFGSCAITTIKLN